MEKGQQGETVEQQTYKTCWIAVLPTKKRKEDKNRIDRWMDGRT